MTQRQPEPQSFDPAQPVTVAVLSADRDLEMLSALAACERRLEHAKLTGVGIEEAELIRQATYDSAQVLFGGDG